MLIRGRAFQLLRNYQDKVVPKRLSVLDILETSLRHRASFPGFPSSAPADALSAILHMLLAAGRPTARRVHYQRARSPPFSGTGSTHLGVVSTYLASPGDSLLLSVPLSNTMIRLAGKPMVPVVIFCLMLSQ